MTSCHCDLLLGMLVVGHSRQNSRLSLRAALSFLCDAQRVLGGSLLGAHVGDVQHERKVPGRVRGDGDAVPRRYLSCVITLTPAASKECTGSASMLNLAIM